MPMHPIVSACGTAAYNTAKFIIKILQNYCDKTSSFVKDSTDFIQKDPIPDAQKTDIIYHWKCPAHNCTAEYIGETNRSLKERVLDNRNQTTHAIRNHHISTKHPKAELKDFTIIDRDSNTPHH